MEAVQEMTARKAEKIVETTILKCLASQGGINTCNIGVSCFGWQRETTSIPDIDGKNFDGWHRGHNWGIDTATYNTYMDFFDALEFLGVIKVTKDKDGFRGDAWSPKMTCTSFLVVKPHKLTMKDLSDAMHSAMNNYVEN